MNIFKILKSTLVLAISFAFFMPFVSADEQEYYTNQNGVVMSIEDYEYLVSNTSAIVVELLTQENYELLMEDIGNYKILESSTKYFITSTFKGADGKILNYEEEVTEDEYNSFEPISTYAYCSDGFVCWETNAKKLYMDVSEVGLNVDVSSTIVWKTVPIVRSYDVTAIRWETSTGGTYALSSWACKVFFNYGLDNVPANQVKILSNGIGASINMGAPTSLDFGPTFVLGISGKFSSKTISKFYGTYQHATKAVTLAQSMSYTLNANGLGATLYYSDANIRNSYDNMSGLYFTVNSFA